MIDFAGINAAALTSLETLLYRWLPDGRLSGAEFIAKNPTRADGAAGSFSINVRSGVWKDFATDGGGADPISLYAYLNGCANGEAAKRVADELHISYRATGATTTTPSAPTKPPPAKWEAIIPVPANAPLPPTTYRRREGNGADVSFVEFEIKEYHLFKGAAGEALGFEIRAQGPSRKEPRPLLYCKNAATGVQEWRYQQFKEPRPLYGLDRLAQAPDMPVVGVEGPRKAQALQALYDEAKIQCLVTAWPGGCKAIKTVDWSPLKGRRVCYWPDADKQRYRADHERAGQIMDRDEQPGFKAAIAISEVLKDIAASYCIVNPPDDKPDGWDVYDAIHVDKWTVQQIQDFIRERRIDPPTVAQSNIAGELHDAPFRCLGYDAGFCYYLPNGAGQVRAIKGEQHTRGALLTLADLKFWASRYSGEKGVNWDRAANACLRACEAQGVYDFSLRRGRGAWWDEGRVVIHLGASLVVDNKPQAIPTFETQYIYETGRKIPFGGAAPLSDKEAARFVEILHDIHWEHSFHADLLAGFLVNAVVCGALDWRSHVWLTGASGTGKSWVIGNIVRPVLGPFAYVVSESTTAPGIRQALRNDALPIIFDESESEDQSSQKRIQGVLELMRSSSCETGAKIRKGTVDGRGQEFDIRSMFLLSSIGVSATQRADLSRLSVLTLVHPLYKTAAERSEHFAKLRGQIAELTREWFASFRARAISMIPVIRKNTEMITRVIACKVNDQRVGDQVGALLAGAAALVGNFLTDEAAINAYLKDIDFGDIQQTDVTDERACLNMLLEHVVLLTPTNKMSVGELLAEIVQIGTQDQSVPVDDYDKALRRIGIRAYRDYTYGTEWVVWISDSHSGIRAILEKSPWAKTWARILARLPKAKKKQFCRFAEVNTRATEIPWSVISPKRENDK